MCYGDFEAEINPSFSSMQKSKSPFGGNPGIFSQNTYVKSTKTINSSMSLSLLASTSWMVTANNLQPFLMHLFACKEYICLTKTFLGIP